MKLVFWALAHRQRKVLVVCSDPLISWSFPSREGKTLMETTVVVSINQWNIETTLPARLTMEKVSHLVLAPIHRRFWEEFYFSFYYTTEKITSLWLAEVPRELTRALSSFSQSCNEWVIVWRLAGAIRVYTTSSIWNCSLRISKCQSFVV